KGRVVRSDQTGVGLANVTVNLMKLKKFEEFSWETGKKTIKKIAVIERTFTTNATGDFKFAYLPVEYSANSPYPINGPVRSLSLSATGFKSKTFKIQGQAQNGALQMGEKTQMGDLPIDPGAIVYGKISDEYGNGITAKIKIGDSPEKTVKPASYFYDLKTGKLIITPGSFEFSVAKLNKQPVIITPVDNPTSYIIDTSYINITKDKQDLGTLKVYHKLHKVNVIVKESQPWTPTFEKPFPPVQQWPSVNAAKVRIQVLGSYLEKKTNSGGQVSFEFSNDANQFKVIVDAPDGKYYVKKVETIINKPSKYPKDYIIVLDKATYVSGSVYVAGNQPVQGADVWLDFGNPDLNISVKTDEMGEYILPNVPIGENVIVYGSKHSEEETIIGDSADVFTAEAGKTGVDLYLTVYNGMDITKLLGFPVHLTGLTDLGNGQVKINGIIKQFKENDLFKVLDSTTAILNFTDIPIKPGSTKNSKGIPYAELSNPPLIFDDASMELKVYKKFGSKLGDVSHGVRMYDTGSGYGVLKGKAFINASSFNTQGSLSGYNGFYLANPNNSGQNKMLIPTITADASIPLNLSDGFNVTNENGGNLNFIINTFNAEADADNSFFKDDNVELRTTLHTNIQNATPSDIKLPIGDVVFHQVGIDPVAGDKPFNFNLDNWSLSASKWVFNKSNLIITEGNLKAGTDIPIKSLDVTPTGFQFADFEFKSMLVSGIVPVTITGNPHFGYDAAKKYWYVSISKKNMNDPYAAYFTNLPGMEPNGLMRMSNFAINSKSDFFSITPEQNQTIKLYKVGILKLTSALLAYKDYLHIPGLGFNIPNVSQSTAVQYYKGNNGQLAFKMKGININTSAGNGVYMKFGVDESQQLSQVLDESGFRSHGVVGEENKFETNCWLYHTIDSTSVLIETPYTPFTTIQNYQTLKIGATKTYLDKLTGGMKVANNKWDIFHFEGDLAGTKGITDDKKRLAFTVYGEIKANNQQISVKDIPTPFGGMNWIYEFENSRLIGTMDINQNMGSISLTGLAEMLIDGSGWYFLAGGTMTVPGIGPGYAAMLFGDYPSMTNSVKEKFAKASYKKGLPNSFQKNISGFLLSGAMSIPVLVPNIDLELGVFVLKFGVNAGGDIKIYKGFDEGGSTYGIGALGFIKAFLTMQSITCTKLTGEVTLEMGVEGSYQTGAGTFNLDGCTSFSIGGHIIQKFYGCDLDGCGQCTYAS
ncbi:MAG: carboxypeptidase-like regulatory domain-containing protein, partial [Ignavibacteriaceae bacterium]|nr:carboxypeptidase-like regulatory domain-containing protein [Ignavibacteriaceae bacterium]